jgi:hypothetical protein
VRRWLREDVWYPLHRRLRRLPRPSLPRRRKARLTRKEADEQWPPDKRCQHCGCWHNTSCPRVKRITFRGDGVAAVEFWEWKTADWDRWTSERNRAVTLVTLERKESMIGDD